MNKLKIIIGILILLGLNSCAQDLTCTDFKEGTFYIPADTVVNKRYTLIRKGNAQVEYANGVEGGDPKYILLEWIDDCSYRAKYDTSKMQLNERQKFNDSNNGIVIEKVNIKGNCMEYMATMSLPDGEEIKQGGKICKE
tara:strand:- start:992 stop:1408 length:417 start_codon:yes stop_codon:yes gene_type:complete